MTESMPYRLLPEMPADPEELARVIEQGGYLAEELGRIAGRASAGRPHARSIVLFALTRLVAEHHAAMACDFEVPGWSPELAARLCRYSMDAAAQLAAELAHQARPVAPWPAGEGE